MQSPRRSPSLVDLALHEAGLAGVALDGRFALGVAEDPVDKFEARRSELLDFVYHALRPAFAIEARDLRGLGQPLELVYPSDAKAGAY